METISYAIIEDDQRAINTANKIIKRNFPQLLDHGSAKNITDGILLINSKKPDLILLDVNLEDGDSFEILKQIDYSKLRIIFTTAYSKHAINAIEFSALAYLVKPYLPDELTNAIYKVLNKISQEEHNIKMQAAVYNSNSVGLKDKILIVKDLSQIHKLEIKHIERLEADSNYTTFFMADNSYFKKEVIVTKPIKEYEKRLPSDMFKRIHDSHIINFNYFRFFDKKNEVVVMTNNKEVPVSQRKRSEFMKFLNSMA